MSDLMRPVPDDHDLDFLYSCTAKELDLFVSILLKSSTNWLCTEDVFKKYYPDHTKYVAEAIAEFQRDGGNSIANLWRDLFCDAGGVCYREILTDVCDEKGVKYDKNWSIETIENALINKLLEQMWGNLSLEEKRKLLNELALEGKLQGTISSMERAGLLLVQTALKSGGLAAGKISLLVAGGVSKAVLGRGLAIGAGTAFSNGLAVLAGPIGWAIGGLLTVVDIAGPALRVTIPATVAIACLRVAKKEAIPLSEAVDVSLKNGQYATCKFSDFGDSGKAEYVVPDCSESDESGAWKWKCSKCGIILSGDTAPRVCRRCGASSEAISWLGQ